MPFGGVTNTMQLATSDRPDTGITFSLDFINPLPQSVGWYSWRPCIVSQ